MWKQYFIYFIRMCIQSVSSISRQNPFSFINVYNIKENLAICNERRTCSKKHYTKNVNPAVILRTDTLVAKLILNSLIQ